MAINFTDSPADGATFTQGAVNFTYDSTKGVWNRSILAAAISTYATLANMPLANVEDDTIARVIDTDKLYIWNGTGWYFLPPTNTNPTITTGGATSYELANDGTATVVTLEANDPEGFAIVWGYSVTAGSLGSTAVVSVSNNVFTITPSTNNANAGNFSLTFTASDGVNLSTSVSEFTLSFAVENSSYTLLNLQAVATGVNSTFVDASSSSHTVTNSGVIAETLSPYRDQGYSAHFGNNDDGISIAATSHFGIQGSDFCIEMWVKPTSKIDPYPRLIQGGSASWGTNDSWTILAGHSDADHGSGTKYSFAAVSISGNNAVLRSTTSIDFGGDWQHVCVTRNGSTFSMYINGTREDTATTSSNLNSSATNALYLGENSSSDSSYHGYMSDVRVIKGSAFRDVSGSGSFDVPTKKLTNVSGTGYTTSLLACQGANFKDYGAGSLSLVVETGVTIKPLTPYDSLFEYSETKHGSSGYFDGASKLSVPDDASLQFGTGDFTIETWYKNDGSSVNYRTIVEKGIVTGTPQNGAYSFGVRASSNALWFAYYNNGFTDITATSVNPNDGAWHHLVAARSGTVFKMFFDGAEVHSSTLSVNFGSFSAVTNIGYNQRNSAYIKGSVSNLRISKGTAVYTAAFTPPILPVTSITNTTFLLNPNPSIIDKSQRSNIALVGDVSGSNTQQLFGSSTMKFDGVGDYLVASSSSADYGYGTLDFTIEFWAYFNSTGTTQTVVSSLTSGSSTAPHLYLLGTDSTLRYFTASGERISSSALSSGTWYHVALSRASGSTKLFIDGTQSGSTYTDSNNYGSSAPFVVGTYYNAGSLVTADTLSGYVQDVRVTKGLARYTSTFTPPTELLRG